MHMYNILLAGLGASVAAALPLDELVARQYPSKPCSQGTGGIHVIAAPGEGYADPPFGLLHTTTAMILKAIPGSTNVSLPYDHAQTNGIQQSHDGAATLRTYIAQYQQACPYTRVALLGYSAGAVIVMNALCGETNPPYPSNIPPLSIPTYSGNMIAAIVYGDETRTAGAHYNYGSCTNNGEHPRSAYAQGNCEKWSQITRSYCDAGDPRCCVATGTNINNHYVYANEYDQAVTSYIVSQFKARGN